MVVILGIHPRKLIEGDISTNDNISHIFRNTRGTLEQMIKHIPYIQWFWIIQQGFSSI